MPSMWGVLGAPCALRRPLLIEYFEDLGAKHAIPWHAAKSCALREFVGLVLPTWLTAQGDSGSASGGARRRIRLSGRTADAEKG